MQQIAQLYALEKEIRESAVPLSEEQIVAIRMERAVPVLDRFPRCCQFPLIDRSQLSMCVIYK